MGVFGRKNPKNPSKKPVKGFLQRGISLLKNRNGPHILEDLWPHKMLPQPVKPPKQKFVDRKGSRPRIIAAQAPIIDQLDRKLWEDFVATWPRDCGIASRPLDLACMTYKKLSSQEVFFVLLWSQKISGRQVTAYWISGSIEILVRVPCSHLKFGSLLVNSNFTLVDLETNNQRKILAHKGFFHFSCQKIRGPIGLELQNGNLHNKPIN